MGVTGLWTIVQPCARPTKLETLNRKRLAVDASIWIYQFLKAVRDKEGNALRNSHVIGFFRRICKLLFFGIKPVFVFDGGAPALKRQTVLGRKRRREGRRDDAVRTAGKLLAVQMQRRLEEDEEKKKREREVRGRETVMEEEELPADANLVYVDEIGMSNQERQQTRTFTKKDAYHLPELPGGVESMGRPDDPRIMSVEELEEYARQFNSGEDINLYDFSKIDFDGDFFMSLPAVDRYNILNAARLRSRLRMGLSKEQLEKMFPDRMAFSKFQIERVRERNDLTQRLMNLNGMNDDAMWGVTGGGRIAGEKDREYVLVKNDGVEGGWALGVVSTDKSLGVDRNKPIDVDAMYRPVKVEDSEDTEEDDDFEDVPVGGLNRLPKLEGAARTRELTENRKRFYAKRQKRAIEQDVDALFTPEDNAAEAEQLTAEEESGNLFVPEEEDEQQQLDRAIALSLQKQFGQSDEEDDENVNFEDVAMPEYVQKAVEEPKPITTTKGRMVAHIVNNRANAAVPKRKAPSVSDSDDENDLGAIFAKRPKQTPKPVQSAPVVANVKNPWDGPLPFEKLKISSLKPKKPAAKPVETNELEPEDEADMAGGFEREDDDAPKPLPPWLVQEGDIRDEVKEQLQSDLRTNAEDREVALEKERQFRRDHGVIEVESSDDESEVEFVDARPAERQAIDLTVESQHEDEKATRTEVENMGDLAEVIRARPPTPEIPQNRQPSPTPQINNNTEVPDQESSPEEAIEWSESDRDEPPAARSKSTGMVSKSPSPTSAPAQVDFSKLDVQPAADSAQLPAERSPSPVFEDVQMPDAEFSYEGLDGDVQQSAHDPAVTAEDDPLAGIDFVDDLSDPEDEELFAQLAIEAEEHARFASELNHKSAEENKAAYERELKALRNQQKKDRRDADEVSHTMITECQALLRLFGLPYITAPMEAEAQCAELVKLGLVDGIVTDDSDIFLFGGTRVYKNMFNSNKFVECYLAGDIEKELSLSRSQLIAIAHLLGSDYTEGLPGIGPVTAVEIISEFSSPDTGLGDFREWWEDVQQRARPKEADASSPWRKKFRRAQATKLFLPPGFPSPAVSEAYLKPEVDSDPQPFQWGVPDLDALRQFLMATIGWSQERTDEVLVPVIKDMNRRETEGTQSNITRYFSGGVGVGARGQQGNGEGEGFAPRVREKESSRMKAAVGRLRAKTGGEMEGTPSRLTGTFADEAREWAEKDNRRIEREKKKAAGGTKGRRGKVRTADGEAAVAGDAVVEADDEDGSDAYVEPTNGSKKRERGRKSRV
jgi:DNA excision repair protein ERCC-5